jgi:uncharacterized protein YoxC
MDPVTALGLACNILQLVETAIKITKQVKEIHNRGALSANDEVKTWANEIAAQEEEFTVEIQAKGLTLSPRYARIRDLAREVTSVNAELKRILNNIELEKNRPGRKNPPLKQILKTYIKKPQLEQLATRLQKCESLLDSTILREL